MEDVNVVVVAGRATRDAELKYTAGGKAVGNVTIAVNKTRKGDDGQKIEEASFIDLTAWGELGEVLAKYVKKGKALTAVGSIKQDRWTTDSGDARSKVVVVLNRLLLGADPKSAGGKAADGDDIPF